MFLYGFRATNQKKIIYHIKSFEIPYKNDFKLIWGFLGLPPKKQLNLRPAEQHKTPMADLIATPTS